MTIIEGHVRHTPERELDYRQQAKTARTVAQRFGVRIEPAADIYGVLHLWAKTVATTRQEVRAIAAFKAITDMPLAWHPAGDSRG